jgi:hypothetical protein
MVQAFLVANVAKFFPHHTFSSHPVTMIFDLFCHIYELVDKEDIWGFSAFFAEKINGHILIKRKVCQQCLSTNLSISTDKKLSVWDIPITSYNELYSLLKINYLNPLRNFC